jgi:hypothetical protein
MQLTEEQIEDRQDLFYTILDNFIEENYDVDEDYEMTDEDAYIVSIIEDYFNENYKFPTLEESVLEDITSYDINTELYQEIFESLLDETIGTFVAGARHGISNVVSKFKSNIAAGNKNREKRKFEKHITNPGTKSKPILKADIAQKQHNSTNFGKGFKGTLSQAYSQGRIDVRKKKAENARKAMQNAETSRKKAFSKHQTNIAKTGKLANRIDTGISNVKNKVKHAITAGAQRVGGILGRAMGHVTA